MLQGENNLHKYLSQRGGIINANTENQETIYRLEIMNKFFFQALNLFSSLWIKPDLSSYTSEIFAVNNEYEQTLIKEKYQNKAVTRIMSNQSSPYCYFSCGNIQSLNMKKNDTNNNNELINSMKEFISTYYSPNLMKVVIISNNSFHQIKEFCEETVEKIESKNFLPFPTLDFDPFNSENLGYFFKIISERNELSFFFHLQEIYSLQKYSPLAYITYLLENPEKGGLLYLLKQKKWGFNLNGNLFESNDKFSLFKLTIDLTENGLKNIQKVINYCFKYIRFLEKFGIEEWRVNQRIQAERIKLLFLEIDNIFNQQSFFSTNLQFLPFENFFTGLNFIEVYNQKPLKKILNSIKLQNSIVLIRSNQFNNNTKNNSNVKNNNNSQNINKENLEYLSKISLRKFNELYKIYYDFKKIDEDFLNETTFHQLKKREFNLMKKNNFLISEENIKKNIINCKKNLRKIKECEEEEEKKLKENLISLNLKGGNKIYYKFINKVPKVIFKFEINFKNNNKIIHDLFSFLLVDIINEELYDALKSGFSFEVNSNIKGINIEIKGFNEKFVEFFQNIIMNINFTSNNFFNNKENNLFVAKNLLKKKIREELIVNEKRANNIFNIIRKNITNNEINEKNVDDIEIANLTDFYNYNNFSINGIIIGNLLEKTAAENISSYLTNNLQSNTFKKKSLKTKRFKFSKKSISLRLKNYLNENINNYIVNFYKIPYYKKNKEEIYIKLVFFNRFLSNQAFHNLRTQLNLGYTIHSKVNLDPLGFQISLEGKKKTPPFINADIEETVLKTISEIKNELKENTFNEIKESAIEEFTYRKSTLNDFKNYYWDKIFGNFNEKYIEFVKNFKLNEFVQFANDINKNLGKISLQFFYYENEINEKVFKGEDKFSNIKNSKVFLNLTSVLKNFEK